MTLPGLPASFRAGCSWASNFMLRHRLALRKGTTTARRLAVQTESLLHEVSELRTNFRRIKKANRITAKSAVNCDQTHLLFEPMPINTIEEKGAKSVPLSVINNPKLGCTLHLAVTQSGQKLAPMIIFKGTKDTPAKVVFPAQRVLVQSTRNAWLDSRTMIYWMKQELEPFMQNHDGILLVDKMAAQISPLMQQEAEESKLKLLEIPTGATSYAQPLDCNIIQSVKLKFQQKYLSWRQTLAPGARPSASQWRNLVIDWVAQVWYSDISKELITKAWAKTMPKT